MKMQIKEIVCLKDSGQLPLFPHFEAHAYRRINLKNNTRLVSLNHPRTTRTPSFFIDQPAIPHRQRRKSFSDGAAGTKLVRLDCYFADFVCAQHFLESSRAKPRNDNKASLRKAVKRASIMMCTVKYWKGQSISKIEVPPILKSVHNQRQSCQSDREVLTARSRKGEQHLVLLNQFRIRVNEKLAQYSKDRTSEKTKSVSHHMPTLNLQPFTSRYSIQNVHMRIK